MDHAQSSASDFESWVQPYWPVMARLARRLSPDGAWEDTLQESLANAWRKRAQFDPGRGAPQSWLLAIVADQARKAGRWQRRGTPHVPQPSPVTDEMQWSQNVDVQRALAQLTARQRLAIELYYYFDLPVEHVAEVMRCSQGTVKSTLSDARGQLRAALGQG